MDSSQAGEEDSAGDVDEMDEEVVVFVEETEEPPSESTSDVQEKLLVNQAILESLQDPAADVVVVLEEGAPGEAGSSSAEGPSAARKCK